MGSSQVIETEQYLPKSATFLNHPKIKKIIDILGKLRPGILTE